VSVLAAVTFVACDDSNGTTTDARVQQGLTIAPVQLNMTGKDRNQVGLGSYLVNAVSGCNDCHTFPNFAAGGNPFLGQPKQINTTNYLAGGRAFGPVCSRNITPDTTGKPAGMDLPTFLTVLRTGTDVDHPGQLLQVMPWPNYQNMTDDDLTAIYAYLSAIPTAQPASGIPGGCVPE
jgi:hypothetical protein